MPTGGGVAGLPLNMSARSRSFSDSADPESVKPLGPSNGTDALPEAGAAAVPLTDAMLVAQMAAGGRPALAALYDRYAPVLMAVALRMLGGRAEAEDLLHDLFLEVWQQARTYDPARGTVRSWLVVRLRSRALDRLKSVAYTRVISLEPGALLDALFAPDTDPILGPSAHSVRQAILQLPEEERQILDLAYFHGLSLSEVATRLDVPLGTVKSRLSRALGKLRHTFDDSGARGQP